MEVYDREKQIQYMTPLFSIAGPDDISRLMSLYKSCVFPDGKFNDAMYLKKAREFMKKMRSVNLSIKPS